MLRYFDCFFFFFFYFFIIFLFFNYVFLNLEVLILVNIYGWTSLDYVNLYVVNLTVIVGIYVWVTPTYCEFVLTYCTQGI